MISTVEGGKKIGIATHFSTGNAKVGTIHRIATTLDKRPLAISPAWLHGQVAAT